MVLYSLKYQNLTSFLKSKAQFWANSSQFPDKLGETTVFYAVVIDWFDLNLLLEKFKWRVQKCLEISLSLNVLLFPNS